MSLSNIRCAQHNAHDHLTRVLAHAALGEVREARKWLDEAYQDLETIRGALGGLERVGGGHVAARNEHDGEQGREAEAHRVALPGRARPVGDE